jgi:hypothetical protein
MNGLKRSTTFLPEPNNSHYEKTDYSYFCIFGARHDAGLVREPTRDNRNDDASDYDKYCACAYATGVTVVTDASDHRRRLLSRERGGSKAVTCAAVIHFTACQRRFAARVCSVQAGHSLFEGPQ